MAKARRAWLWVTSMTVSPRGAAARKQSITRSGRVRIQAAGGFVGQQQARREHHRARDRHALHFAGAEHARRTVGGRREPELVQQLQRAPAYRPAIVGQVAIAEHHVLHDGAVLQQVKALEDHAHMVAARAAPRGFIAGGQRFPSNATEPEVGTSSSRRC